MKKMKWVALWVLVLLTIAGCASTAGFNKTYMPKAVPDKPNDKLMLTPEDSRVVSKYLSQRKLTIHIGLYWLEENLIYLNLAEDAVFGIDTKTKLVQELQDADAKKSLQVIARKLNIAPDHEGRAIIRQFAASVFSYMGHKFSGDVTDNKHKISVEIKTAEKRDASVDAKCEAAKIKGQLTNSKGKITDVEWDYDCAWVMQSVTFIKVPQMLSSLQVSPSGKYYLYGSLLYSVNRNALVGDVLKSYPGTLSVSVNPDWSKIAVLRGQGKTYWIEIFDFQIDDKREPSNVRIDI